MAEAGPVDRVVLPLGLADSPPVPMLSPTTSQARFLLAIAALLTLLAGVADGRQVIIPFGATWRYLDIVSDLGTAWLQPEFDDSGWASGRGEFGYGEGDETTVLSVDATPAMRPLTAYFRYRLELPDPEDLPGLRLDILRDDGVVVYVNGIEVGRSNMPAGEINFETLAVDSLAGNAEKQPATIIVAPGLLYAGSNTIAVEVHQESRGSSDLSFDLEASDAIGATPPQLELALLAISGSNPDIAVTALDIRASDCDSDASALRFTVSGVESGRFELVAAPGAAINTFTQSQLVDGQVRFVPEEARFAGASIAGTLDLPFQHEEISGLVASVQNPGILWAHEDSDNPATLIALGTDAGTRGEWALAGLTNIDWEDIAAARVGGQALLYIGDFGDNGAVRSNLKIYRIREPLLGDDGTGSGIVPAADIETIGFRYPDSPVGEGGGSARDAESMLIDPHSGDIYILSKRESLGRLFRLAHQASYTGTQTLEYIGDMPAITPDFLYGFSSSATAADISGDGLEVLVRNYGHIQYFRRPATSTPRSQRC